MIVATQSAGRVLIDVCVVVDVSILASHRVKGVGLSHGQVVAVQCVAISRFN